LAGPRQHRPTALSHAVLAPASLRPSAICSSPARLQPQSLIGCAAFGNLLAADTSSEQLPSDALLRTWHRLRLAVLHSIWTASQIAQASQPTQPSDTSEPDAILASSPLSQQASLSSSSTSRHGHLARQLALKTVKAMIHNDWTKCNDNIKQISGVCSSWLRGKDPSMTLAAFQSFWCHNGTLASVTSPSGAVDGRLELQLHLSATCPVLLF